MPLSISRRPLAAALCVVASAASALAQGFAPGMTLFAAPSGLDWGWSPALSEDGTALGAEYFNWTTRITSTVVIRSEGRYVLPTGTRTDDVSDAGAFTVDYATRRDLAGNSQTLLPGVQVSPDRYVYSRINGDGTVIAGTRQDRPDFPTQAFRWTAAGGAEYLPAYRTNALYTNVFGVSRDGSTIVGDGSMFFGSAIEAWTWTTANGFQILPPATGARFGGTRALTCNGDGTIVAGLDAGPVFGTRAVIWANGVPTVIPTPAGYRSSQVVDLTDDGSLLIGTLSDSLVGLPETSAIWTASTGWVPALDYMRELGFIVPEYLRGYDPFEVSADGSVFSTRLLDTRTGERMMAVFTVPAPGAFALLLPLTLIGRRSRNASSPSPNARRG